MAGRVLVSTLLFPPNLLMDAVKQTCVLDKVRIAELDDGIVSLEFLEGGANVDVSATIGRFKRTLTALSLRTPEPHTFRTDRRPTTLTLDIKIQLRASEEFSARVVATVRVEEIAWEDLLCVLRTIRNTGISLETTSPADRYVVQFDLPLGADPSVVVGQVVRGLWSMKEIAT